MSVRVRWKNGKAPPLLLPPPPNVPPPEPPREDPRLAVYKARLALYEEPLDWGGPGATALPPQWGGGENADDRAQRQLQERCGSWPGYY